MVNPPRTHSIDVNQALDTLSFEEMVALGRMYERWALTEPNITPDQRTKLIEWSSDYERIAEYAGPGWEASLAQDGLDVVAFVARSERRAQRLSGAPEEGTR